LLANRPLARSRHAPFRGQGLFHYLWLREGVRTLQRSRIGRRAGGTGDPYPRPGSGETPGATEPI